MGETRIVIAFIVSSIGLTSVQASDHMGTRVVTSSVSDESQIQENFRNLFDSITKNNVKNIGAYRNALEQEALREQLAFGSIKEEVRFPRRKNAYKQTNLYSIKNDNLVEKAVAFKREIHEDNHETITETTVMEGDTTRTTTETKKYYCRYKGKKMEPGEIRLSISDCEIWVCRNDTFRYGHLWITKCLTVDYRDFQNFHDACIEHNCDVYEVDTSEPVRVGLEPGLLRIEKNDNNTLWTAAFY